MLEEHNPAMPEELLRLLFLAFESDFDCTMTYSHEEWKPPASLERLEEFKELEKSARECHAESKNMLVILTGIEGEYPGAKYLTRGKRDPEQAKKEYDRYSRKLRESKLAPDSPKLQDLKSEIERLKKVIDFHLDHPDVFEKYVKAAKEYAQLSEYGLYLATRKEDARKNVRG